MVGERNKNFAVDGKPTAPSHFVNCMTNNCLTLYRCRYNNNLFNKRSQIHVQLMDLIANF